MVTELRIRCKTLNRFTRLGLTKYDKIFTQQRLLQLFFFAPASRDGRKHISFYSTTFSLPNSDRRPFSRKTPTNTWRNFDRREKSHLNERLGIPALSWGVRFLTALRSVRNMTTFAISTLQSRLISDFAILLVRSTCLLFSEPKTV